MASFWISPLHSHVSNGANDCGIVGDVRCCSPLQLAPTSGPQSLCFPPPLSSSPGARPRWPACWAATLLREPWWAGRWTVHRWQRGCWAARRRRRADATAAAAPWAWTWSAGWKESSTPARSSTLATARPRPSTGASVRARGAGWSPAQLLLSSIWAEVLGGEETKALCVCDNNTAVK